MAPLVGFFLKSSDETSYNAFFQMSIPFCRMHAYAACAVLYARFPIQSAKNKTSVLPDLMNNSFEFSMN